MDKGATDMTIPAYETAKWEDGRVVNKGELPLWSGKGEPPAVGEEVTVNDKRGTRVVVTGYEVEAGWLMVTGTRIGDGMRGNLAGAEILY